MVTKKKLKTRALAPGKVKAIAAESMALFEKEAKARYDKSRKLYIEQDDETMEALERMITLLCRIARKNMWVSAGAERIVMQIPEQTIYHNMHYMAVEILKDLAQFDIKVANFKFSEMLCATCYSDHVVKKSRMKKMNTFVPKVKAKKKVKS